MNSFPQWFPVCYVVVALEKREWVKKFAGYESEEKIEIVKICSKSLQ